MTSLKMSSTKWNVIVDFVEQLFLPLDVGDLVYIAQQHLRSVSTKKAKIELLIYHCSLPFIVSKSWAQVTSLFMGQVASHNSDANSHRDVTHMEAGIIGSLSASRSQRYGYKGAISSSWRTIL